ncbi:MAG: Sec-independent protein translocase protein TatB [Pseudomonadota bacterium]
MFDIGWQELIVIGVLALLVVGPKELPGLFRTVGQYVGKARRIAREFQRSMEDAARDVDGGALNQIRDAKRDFDKMARVDFSEQAKRAQDSLVAGGKTTGAKTAPSGGTSAGGTSAGGASAGGASGTAAPGNGAAAKPEAPAAAPATTPAPTPAASPAPAPAAGPSTAPAGDAAPGERS